MRSAAVLRGSIAKAGLSSRLSWLTSMHHFPDRSTFGRLAEGVTLVPVSRRLLSDTLTPVSAFRVLDAGACACLFESVIGGEKVGRYSFLASEPFLLLEAAGARVRVLGRAPATPTGTQASPRRPGAAAATAAQDGLRVVEEFACDDPVEELKRRVQAFRVARVPGLPPFCGGAVGYAGYDVVRYTERLPNPPPDDRRLPDLAFAFFDHLVVFDNVNKTIVVTALARLDQFGGDLDGAYADACRRVDALVERLSRPAAELAPADIHLASEPRLEFTSNFPQPAFEAAVERCLEYIRAGDIFQVVLSQRLETPLGKTPPFEVYRTLRVVNPSPFMFYLRLPEVTLVGSSPEIMVRVAEGRVTVRPLAGTRRRGRTEEEDRQLERELLADEKERAEHVMLVDLGRNDVGRVARYGSVELSDVMVVERYSHVMHITSNVCGTLAEGRDAFDALRACLPAGTVSGAPKVRAMEIIDELEPHRRGPYAGAVGYVDFAGNMDTCIALRTIVVAGDKAYVQAGAGIVADSVPASEYQETLNKARGLLKAIEATHERLSG